MCKKCPKEAAAAIAQDTLDDFTVLPEWQTHKRETIDDILAFVLKSEHITDKQTEYLLKLCNVTPEEFAELQEELKAKEEKNKEPTSQILLSCALVDHRNGRVYEAEQAARKIISNNGGDPNLLVASDKINWDELRKQAGGWNESYELAAEKFAAIILLPTSGDLVARGQYSLAEAFLERNKPVMALIGGKFEKVTSLEELEDKDWKTGYGKVVYVQETA